MHGMEQPMHEMEHPMHGMEQPMHRIWRMMPCDEATAPHPAQRRDGAVARAVPGDDGGVGAELSGQRRRPVVGKPRPPA